MPLIYKTECQCPKCEKIYTIVLEYEYTGRARYMPRYCNECRLLLFGEYENDTYGIPDTIDESTAAIGVYICR